MEIWKSIPLEGFEHYLVSDKGRISNGKKIMKSFKHPDGYRRIQLSSNGVGKKFFVHRLVAYAFIGFPKDEKMQINHLNCKPNDNRVSNLEWITPSENIIYSFNHGKADLQKLRDMSIKANKKAVEVLKKPIKIINNKTNEEFIFESVIKASEVLGLDKRAVSAIARGDRKSHKGYSAFYLEVV